ncbi:hypothetical protein EYW49_20990 [Siculibacillus lacustris]|uniref:Lipoprotein n=1 Tax=Siculibacillus lacustris TaxID=1549641 RepID=A0A4Q9VEB5_9HYPH|nr:hypothetical protein [Siculibacillus lacustris]TBW33003.1 hypothetical protein EYW49_20990 [Siculibacillus lacustris]
MAVKTAVMILAALALAGCQTTSGVTVSNDGSEITIQGTLVAMSGAELRIEFGAALDTDCTPTTPPPVFRLVKAPEHGTFATRSVEEFPNFSKDSPRSACNLKRVPGELVTYRSEPGWTGRDTLIYEIFLRSGRRIEKRATIDVR